MSSSASRSRKAQRFGEVGAHAGAVAAEGVEVAAAGDRRRHGPVVVAVDEGHEIDGAEAHRDLEAGSLGADAGHDLAQEPGAVLEAAAVLAGAVDGAQELVAQVAVAMLDVDEVEAGPLGEPGGPHEVGDDPLDLAVAHDGVVAGGVVALVEQRVMVQGARLGAAHVVGVRDAPRVGELDADVEVVDRVEMGGVRSHQQVAQPGDVGQRLLEHDELTGAAPALGADGDRLGAEDELGAAQAPALPAAPREVGGTAVGGAVPALHRQDGEAVADRAAVQVERLGERRLRARLHRVVERQLDVERLEIAQQRRCIVYATNVAHVSLFPSFPGAAHALGSSRAPSLLHRPATGASRDERSSPSLSCHPPSGGAGRGGGGSACALARRLRSAGLAVYSSATSAPTLLAEGLVARVQDDRVDARHDDHGESDVGEPVVRPRLARLHELVQRVDDRPPCRGAAG